MYCAWPLLSSFWCVVRAPYPVAVGCIVQGPYIVLIDCVVQATYQVAVGCVVQGLGVDDGDDHD